MIRIIIAIATPLFWLYDTLVAIAVFVIPALRARRHRRRFRRRYDMQVVHTVVRTRTGSDIAI